VQEQEQEDYHSPRDKVPRELENNRRVKSIHKKKKTKTKETSPIKFPQKRKQYKSPVCRGNG
jgi:hypothetical protein